jgi:uroporphyrinogen decarboxylase
LSVADVLAFEKGLPYHMQHHPKELHAALEMITEYTIPFARQCVEAGADGVFYAIRNPSRKFFSDERYLEFGKPYDLRILEAVRGASFNMVHACQGGVQELMVDVLSDYPVHAMSWATEESFPSLREARVVWPNFCLVGGIDQHGLLTHGTTEQVKSAVRWAATCSGTRHMMVAGGCTIRLPHIEENLLAARQAIDEVKGS